MKENRIVFFTIPESLREQLAGKTQSTFVINPDIPVPVEIPDNLEKINPENLTIEAILSAMLRVIQEGEEKGEWIDYYRNFVFVLRPGIFIEFTEAAAIKARNGDFDSAQEILSVLEGLFPSSPLVMLNRALVYEEQALQYRKSGREEHRAVQAASALYEKLSELDPPFTQALYSGGFFHFYQNDFPKTAEYFSRFTETTQDEDKKKQVEKILKSITDNGLDDESFTEANKLIREGKVQEALNSIHDFLERRPLVNNGWFVLGWALRLLGRWADGEAAFRKAIELGGDSSDARNELAICLMERENYTGAKRELEAALKKDPENVKIISNLGVLALKDGKKEEAAAFFRTVLELDEGDPVAKKFLEGLK
jgi:tetratricopeptide (TPR) repeat protein